MASQQTIKTAENKQTKNSGLSLMVMTDVEFDAQSGASRRRQFLKPLVEVFKHPFILLLIGAITTSLLVPYLTSKVNRNQLLREARQKKAIEIGNRNTEFNSKFNALKTMLESFHNQNVRLQLQPSELREVQLKFRDEFTKRYLELDERAWWWYSDIAREASVLGLIPESELQSLDVDLKEYAANIDKSFYILKPLWVELTSSNYNPNDEKSRTKIKEILANTSELGALLNNRSAVIERISRHYTSLE